MKRNGKKILILLITLLMIDKVHAVTVGDYVSFGNAKGGESYQFRDNGDYVATYATRYKVRKENDKNVVDYDLFCLDPSAKTGGRRKKVTKILSPSDAFDAGLLTMLRAKASDYGLSDGNMYTAKSIATRVYVWRDKFWWNAVWGYRGSKYTGKKNAMYGQAILWEAMDEFKFLGKNDFEDGIYASQGIMKVAYQLYKDARKIQQELTNNPKTVIPGIPKVTVNTVLEERFSNSISSMFDETTGIETQSRYIVVNYSAENFNQNNASFVISGASVGNNKEIKIEPVGISNKAREVVTEYESRDITGKNLFVELDDGTAVYVPTTPEPSDGVEQDGETTENTEPKVEKTKITSDNGYITLNVDGDTITKSLNVYVVYKITVTLTNSNENIDECGNKTIKFSYNYSDAEFGQGIWVGTVNKTGAVASTQRFIGYTPDSVDQSYNAEVKVCQDTCNPTYEMPSVCPDNMTTDANGNVTYKFVEGKDVSGNENIKRCILKKTDNQGNSYQLVDNDKAEALKDNPYCEVYCKEGYSFTVPYQIHTNNGRYINIAVDISGRQDCYSTKLDPQVLFDNISDIIDQFNNDNINTEEANAERMTVEDAKAEINDNIKQYNACVKNIQDGADGWDLNYEFDPIIKYSYNEPHGEYACATEKWIDQVRQKVNNGDVMVALNKDFSDVTVEYCDGEVNNDYTCRGTLSNTYQTNTANYTINGQTISYEYATADYVHKFATVDAKYDTPRIFYSVHPTGRIEISSSAIENADIVEGLPIGFNTPNGKYFYILSLSNIGRYYDLGDSFGRIYGTDYSNDGGKMSGNFHNARSSSIVETDDECNENETTQIETNAYACSYTVNATACYDEYDIIHTKDECNPGEDWSDCQLRICHCPRCEIIYIENMYDFNVRPITPSNINPNDRNLGYNWNSSTNNPNYILANKAQNTISEIEDRANATLDDLEDVEKYTFKVKLTPDMISDIKNYNDAQKTKGNYSNETLECYDYTIPGNLDYSNLSTDMANKLREISGNEQSCKKAGYRWKDNSCVMSHIFCYSKFIDEYYVSYPNNFDQSIMATREESKTQVLKNYQIASSQYGALLTTDYWTIYEYTTLDITGDKMADIGPSWK